MTERYFRDELFVDDGCSVAVTSLLCALVPQAGHLLIRGADASAHNNAVNISVTDGRCDLARDGATVEALKVRGTLDGHSDIVATEPLGNHAPSTSASGNEGFFASVEDAVNVEEAIQNYLTVLGSERGYPYSFAYDLAKVEIAEALLEERGLPLAPTAEHQATWPPEERYGKKPGEKQLPRGLRLDVLKRDKYTCQDCLATEDHLTIDHIHPRSKGGSDEPYNLQVLCRRCNTKKGSVIR